MANGYKGFLTDIDDTLFATSDFLPNALHMALKKMIEYGLNADFDDAMAELLAIREHDSNAGYHFNMLLAAHGNDPFDQRIIVPGVDAYHNTKFALLERREGVMNVLNYLREKDFRLGVVSSGRKDKQIEKLDRLGILDFFIVRKGCKVVDDYIFIAGDNNKQELFKMAVKKMDLDLEKTIALDDRLKGIHAANLAGIKYTIKLKHGKYRGQTPYSILLDEGIDYKRLLNPDKKTKRIIRSYTPKFEVSEWTELPKLIDSLIKYAMEWL